MPAPRRGEEALVPVRRSDYASPPRRPPKPIPPDHPVLGTLGTVLRLELLHKRPRVTATGRPFDGTFVGGRQQFAATTAVRPRRGGCAAVARIMRTNLMFWSDAHREGSGTWSACGGRRAAAVSVEPMQTGPLSAPAQGCRTCACRLLPSRSRPRCRLGAATRTRRRAPRATCAMRRPVCREWTDD